MVKTRGGMASSHTPTKRRSSRMTPSNQGQEGCPDPAVPLVAEPLNVIIPPDFNVPSESSSSSEEISDFAQNPKETADEIDEESTPTATPVPVRQMQTGESSKIKTPPTQEEMAAMLAAVHKLIDDFTEKNTPSSPPVSPTTAETIPSQPKNVSSNPVSSSVQKKSSQPSEILPNVPVKKTKHAATKKFTKKAVDRRQSARLKASVDPLSEPAEKIDISTDDSESSSEEVTEKVTTSQKTKRVAMKSVPPASTINLKKAIPSSSKPVEKTHPKVPPAKKQKTAERYDDSFVPVSKFCDARSKIMWDFVCKRKPLSERVIDIEDYKKIEVYELLNDRKLLGTVTMPKHYNKEIVLEFYANLKADISDVDSPFYHKVTVRSHDFEFSPKIISDYLNCKKIKSQRKRELDVILDMNRVIVELTAQSTSVWPSNNKVPSSTLSVKYSALHKIALTNWLPSLHKTYVTKDMACLLYMIGTGEKFDMGKLLFEVIVYNAEQETTYGILPLPSLIYEVLMLQKNVLGEDEMLEVLPPPLKVSHKLFEGKHVPDIKKATAASTTVPETVFTSADNHADLVQFLSSEIVQIKRKRKELAAEDSQLAARETQIEKLLISLLPVSPPFASVSADDDTDSATHG